MAKQDLHSMVQNLRWLLSREQHANLSDVQPLGRYLQERDESAFAVLVHRHGRLVVSVCQRVLHDAHEAEDATQAAFLILARKAASIRHRPAIGSWLYQVAHRLALKMRTRRRQQRLHEKQANLGSSCDPLADASWQEVRTILDEELARLPDKHRAPLLLCYFEERTHEEAARQLGWPVRTLKVRLARGRELLRGRLARRGVRLGSAVLVTMLSSEGAKAHLPAQLGQAICRAAIQSAAGLSIVGTVSPSVHLLMQGALRDMAKLIVLKLAVATVILSGLLAGSMELILGQSAPGNVMRKPAGTTAAAVADKSQKKAKASQPATPLLDANGDPLPLGAVLRLGSVRLRPGWVARASSASLLSFTTSQTVVAANRYEVQLWDVESGKLLREIPTNNLSITSFSVSANGKFVAVSGFMPSAEEKGKSLPVIAIWEIPTAKQVRLLHREVNGNTHSALALTPDGKLLITLDKVGVLCIEDAATGKEVRRHQLPRSGSDSLAVSADGSLLAIAGGALPRKLLIWKWQGAEDPRELSARPDPAIIRFNSQFVAISADGKTVAEAGDTRTKADKGVTVTSTVRMWDLATGQIVRRLSMPANSFTRGLAISPDGKTVIASALGNSKAGGMVQIWDTTTGRLRRSVEQEVGALAVSPDSRLLAGAAGGAICIWELATGKELSANNEAHLGNVSQVAAAGNRIVTGAADRTVRIWDAVAGKQLAKLGHGGGVRAAALSPDATKVVTSSFDDSVNLWDAATGIQLYKLPGHGKTGMFRAAAGFTPDGKYFFSCSDDLQLRKWETATGKPVLDYKLNPRGVNLPDDPRDPRSMMETRLNYGNFAPDGSQYVLPVAGLLHVFDVTTGKDLRQISNPGNLGVSWSLAMSPDGRLILEGGSEGGKSKSYTFTLYEVATGLPRLKLEFAYDLTGQPGPVAFSPDGKLFAIATGEPGHQIRLYLTAGGKEAGAIQGFRGNAESLAFTADNMRLISGMDDTTAIVWDVATALARGKR